MNMQDQGLYHKFNVSRTDGRDAPGEKHAGCEYFVLDINHDQHAIPALLAYAESCAGSYPLLAADLRTRALISLTAENEFVTVPDVTLPNGMCVPSFKVGKFLCSKGPTGMPLVNARSAPWVEIDYHAARTACTTASLALITELQALALAHDIVNQDINWSGGAVGEGHVFQGLHKGSVDEAHASSFIPVDEDERRWHELSNGERIFDFAGNAYTWVFDDVQGDENGIVAKGFNADSPSIAVAPYPSMERGMGWRPEAGRNRSGHALLRGGCWYDEDNAGVFTLDLVSPDNRDDIVGFRCTKPSSGL
jgi:hypothetical protein